MRPNTGNRALLGVRWGAAFSALLHLGLAAAVLLVLPETKKPKATPTKVPVEIVRPLEKKPDKKKPAKKMAKEKKQSTAAKVKPKPAPKAPQKKAEVKLPEKPKPAKKQKPLLAEKAKPKPAPEKPKPLAKPPEPKKATSKKVEPKIAEPVKEPAPLPSRKRRKPPEKKTAANKPAKQLAEKPAKPKPKGGGRKVKPKADNKPQISLIQRKLVGQWFLQPLKVNLQHRCGKASLSGVINLTKKRGNRFFGTLRTTIRWAHCPAEGAVYQIVLRIRGNRVVMLDASGVLDRGLIQGDIMVLKDAYGRSVWRRGP